MIDEAACLADVQLTDRSRGQKVRFTYWPREGSYVLGIFTNSDTF